ncbi:hypothetical protein NR458_05920 [Pediococcus ethanolidurans]|uniref:hypothetical protein n=1 Tax=Pediococcus ethanolidurans TaxID=319653 RepID=UPI0021E8FE6B|nr:hypothetical protein [Pediococcus ethanolidurans]MCV3323820.1 hypothetical protein [Pediococcus ethanolidurans]
MIKKQYRLVNWIEQQLKTQRSQPENLFVAFGYLNQVMGALEDKQAVNKHYDERTVSAARALMQMTNEQFLGEVAKIRHKPIELSGEGIQVLRWFKDRNLNDQGNLVSNLGFLTEIVNETDQTQITSWDRQTVKVAKMANRVSNDELIAILLNCQSKAEIEQLKQAKQTKQIFRYSSLFKRTKGRKNFGSFEN